ncbi:isoprenyl transferase [Microaerobacter geothermalis]|uniref:isoprenyl transferase n=1 Tax=Microaerobacter geothermalis TaxID=674972 RepID=UPI001F2E2C22|nr:isoprenyl transferase [Microaerobacter geothermalis]MCF6093803.1 isoprenyl transferase [Microaerobacter geothermalis]
MLHKFTQWLPKKDDGRTNLMVENNNLPRHIAIIMDGNGRWAKEKGLPRIAGHRAGMRTVKNITKAANEIGIKILTLYAFSTENWKRPKEEVDYLMKLPQEFLVTELEELIENNVQVKMVGEEAGLPPYTLEAVKTAIEKTKENDGLILNFALNYGSRNEMVNAVKQISTDVINGDIAVEDINEETISNKMLTSSFSDPDLLIRTSGEIRLSNFMLWQLAYTELWFTDVRWPDFTREHFYEAIRDYQQRSRRYGSI